MDDDGLDSSKVMKIISHPVRLRIIELLASKGPLSWKELSNELGVKTGALYHHLDTLEQIVTRDPQKRYVLTKKGAELNNYLSQNASRAPQNVEKAMKRRTAPAALRNIFVPRSVMLPMTSSVPRSLIGLLVLSTAVVGCLMASGSQLLFFSLSNASGLLPEAGTYFASLAAITAVGWVSVRVFFHERSEPFALLSSSAFSFVPVVAFGLILHYLVGAGLEGILADRTALTLVFAFFQAWGAGIMGAGMSVASGLRIEKTLMVSLILLYATMLIVFLNGGALA